MRQFAGMPSRMDLRFLSAIDRQEPVILSVSVSEYPQFKSCIREYECMIHN